MRRHGGAGGDEESAAERSDGLVGRVAGAVLPGFVRRRYAAKFLLAMCVVVLLISAVGGLSYVQIRDIIEEDAEGTLRSSATLQSDSIEEWIAGMEAQTGAVASSDVLVSGDDARINAYLEDSLTRAGDDVTGIHLVDRESERIVASTDDRFGAQPLDSRSPAWRDAIDAVEGDAVGSSQTAFERQGRVLMAFAATTREGDGWIVVVGDAGRDVEQLHATGVVVRTRVLTGEGLEVFETRGNTPSDLVDEPAFQDALAGETRIVERERDVLAFAPVDGEDWVVVTEAPKSELYEASRTVGRNVLVLVAASLATLAVVGFVLGRGTVVPLARLRRRANEMEAGNLDVDLETDREDEVGQLFAAFASMRDALRDQIETAEDATEAAEASRRELERQNARLDEFAGTVSHDLRNPLTVAGGQLTLLAEAIDEEEPDPDELDARVRAIADAHERIETIVDDVLALARGDETIDAVEPVSIATAAEAAWSTVDTAGATLSIEGDRTVEADRTRLLRALENLFRNSVEHGGDDVTITVEPTDGGFAVTDDGPGIDVNPDEAFAHGYSGTADGTGLGLAIVRSIAEAHGWTVTIDERSTGARFVFDGVDGVD